MDICLMIEGQEGVAWEDWTDLARSCERNGFDALFRSDHYLSFDDPERRGALDAWATLAGLAAVTDRIKLGTMVSPVTFRHPAILAKSVVTVDHISGGRIELGMGAGWFEDEHRAFGFPFPPSAERIEILSEQVEIVHRLWDRDEDEVTFDGTHYRLEASRALPKPLQDPHPNLILGGGAGPRSAALAARWADEYNVNYLGAAEVRDVRTRLSKACEAIGRDPAQLRLSLMTGIVVGADRSEVERRATELLDRGGKSEDVGAAIARWRSDRLVGTADEVLETLARYAEAGVERVMVQHLLHGDLDALDLIGAEIIPAIEGR
jgi:F420-dependent oxidoreductase-like protein